MDPSLRRAARAAQGWVRRFGATAVGARVFARVLHHLDRTAFRLSRGRGTVTSTPAGLPVVMLTTTGAHTGMPRTVPLLGFPVGGDIAVAAGNFGRARDPAWCLNLRREAHASIVVGGEQRPVVAEELTGAARQTVWQAGLRIYPGAAAYAKRAGGRTIGVFLLHPIDGADRWKERP